jgi:restriction system protein
VRYVASRDALEEGYLRPNELNSLYDSVCYQICLRTVNEIFSADDGAVIKAVIFNGWVNFIDPATGKETHACIISLQAKREEFVSINLKLIDPKACFKTLKGVGSAQLHSMAAVTPLLRLNRQDRRFIESSDVADRLDQGTNLAAIGWEDFEQLVREIFEKEFSSNGGEVKITRASRDGGVDAVAFDPDPIRGGKIVIQAKRYTNTVDVSAVRDLYGTVMNEGATKGILVTTSSYGPDAYSFAKDKPITLLDGGNLLYLLERHGHKAYINLPEAKLLNKDQLTRRS